MDIETSNSWRAAHLHFQRLYGPEHAINESSYATALPAGTNHSGSPALSLINEGWLAGRMLFWPRGASMLWRISLISSRLPERRDMCTWWYDAFRTSCARCNPDHEALLTVPGTTCFKPAVRASELFGIPRIEVSLPNDDCLNPHSAVTWLDARVKEAENKTSDSKWVTSVFLSPPFREHRPGEVHDKAALRDIVSFAMADRIVILHCRKGGNIWNLSANHNQQSRPAIVMVAQTSRHTHKIKEIESQGFIPWFLFDDSTSLSTGQLESNIGNSANQTVPSDSLQSIEASSPVSDPDEWLCHWTRPFRSAWPNQSPDDFLDELILGCESADRSALAALIRITDQKKLIATVARREESPTVSFTEVSLAEFRQRRVFRGHRRRYDFEPYGVAIRKSELVRLSARPVKYVDNQAEPGADDSEASLEAEIFQQPRFDRSRKIDWSSEREWRLRGDLDLSVIDPSSVVIFVNEETERTRFPKTCSWPIIVVPNPS